MTWNAPTITEEVSNAGSRAIETTRSRERRVLPTCPVIGPIRLLVEPGLLRGSAGPNRFGPDPLAATPDAVLA